MATEVVEILIEGGKATAAPPLGPALGPLGVNIGQIVVDINKKTADFKGMQVPVKVTVDKSTKAYTISIGTPPSSQLLIKESGIKNGSASPNKEFAADLKIEQIIKISQMKQDALLGSNAIMRVKEILGTCQSMGIMVEGKPASQTLKDVTAGKFDEKIKSGKTALSAEELKELEVEKKKLQEEMKGKRDEYLAKANSIYTSLKEKDRKVIENAMKDAGIPVQIMNEVLPAEEEKKGAKK